MQVRAKRELKTLRCICGELFTQKRWWQKYCSTPCRDNGNNLRYEIEIEKLQEEIERLQKENEQLKRQLKERP